MLTCRFLRRSFPALSVATALAIGSVEPSDAAPNLTATLVDRDGNRYDVTRLRFQDRYELEIYADDVRQLIMLADVDRIQMSGDKGAEELDIVLQLRSGRELKATIYSGTAILNRILTREGVSPLGVIVTAGFEDVLRFERGIQVWLGRKRSCARGRL